MKKIVLIIILIIGTNYNCHSANSKFTQEPIKILFIGGSYFNFNDLPDLFKNLADFSGKEVYIDQYIPSGLYLSDHANNNITESKIKEKDWDYVIFQGVLNRPLRHEGIS